MDILTKEVAKRIEHLQWEIGCIKRRETIFQTKEERNLKTKRESNLEGHDNGVA